MSRSVVQQTQTCQNPKECVCQYISSIKSVEFSSRQLENGNTKQIYIVKLDRNVADVKKKDLTIHHFQVTAKVGNESKSCHLFNTPVQDGKPFERRHFLKLYFAPDCTKEVIKDILKCGFTVREPNRKPAKFEFFGHSASNQREGICVLYDTSLGPWNSIIELFGKFQKLKTVAKFSARIGLLLSTTIGGVDIGSDCLTTDDNRTVIDDVERNGFCFTDGCGLISVNLAHELSQKLDLDHLPSVFQIRLKGCKGVVCLDPTLKGRQIRIRKSMEKFEWVPAEPYYLGIVDSGVSRPYTYGHLNKQYICLLSANGIKDQVFLNLQEEYFRELESLESNEDLALKYLCVEENWKLVEKLTRSCEIDNEIKNALESIRMSAKGSKDNKDEGNKLNAKPKKPEAKKLKIPVWQSRLLFGVCDHTNMLKSGEVFVRVTQNGKPTTLQDGTTVAVMRSPSYSAGDCRRLKCRNIPLLDSLVDCIVFPIQGDRPHPDEISGGDLDGDQFFVCWEPRLVPKRMEPAKDYKGLKGKDHQGPITQQDCIECFANYDRFLVGRMSNLFTRWADSSDLGIKCPQCILLNQRFSKAIDAAKTGTSGGFGEVQDVPEPLQGEQKKVWAKMEDKADLYLANQLDLKPDITKCLELNDFVDFIIDAPASISEFQKFRLAYLYCKKFESTNELKEIIHRCIDVNSFTDIQKELLPVDLNCDLERIANQLHKSQILSKADVDHFEFDAKNPWSLYYKNYDDNCFNWNVLRNVLESDMRTLIVLKYLTDDGRAWAIAMYLTENLSSEGNEVMKMWKDKAQIHFFQLGGRISQHRRWQGENQMQNDEKNPKNWYIELTKDKKRFDIYDCNILGDKPFQRPGTFINIQETNGETITSIAIDQLGIRRNDVQIPYSRLRKKLCSGCEIFVQYPYSDVAPILLQQRFPAEQQIGDVNESKKFKLNEDDLNEFLYNVDDFPNVQDKQEQLIEVKPLQAAERILKTDGLQPEIVAQNISIVYQTLMANPQISDIIAGKLIFYLWKHKHRLDNSLQYCKVLISLMRGSCSNNDWIWLSFLNQNRTEFMHEPGDDMLCRISNLLDSMVTAEIKFTVNDMKSIFHSVLTTMNNHELMIYVLDHFKENLLTCVPESPFRGERYFLHFASLITMETLHELRETTVQAEEKQKKEQIFTALASNSSNKKSATSDENVKNEKTSNPNCVYKLSFLDPTVGFKIGSAVNLCPAKENEKRPKFQMGFIAEILKFRANENSFLVRGLLPDPHPIDDILAQKLFRVDPITNLVPYHRTMDALDFLCYSSIDYDVPPVMAHLINSFSVEGAWESPECTISTDLKSKIHVEKCNRSQFEAIESAMTYDISLIQGPPGTGKTKTAALIVKYWIEAGYYPILCVAETNEAVNNLCMKLIDEGLESDVVRVGGTSESLKKISLEEIYNERYPTASKATTFVREEFLEKKKVEHILREKKVIAVTCKAAGRDSLSLSDSKFENRKLFKAILVDEAAQVVEPAVLIPLSQSYCERLCLVGDDQQLPPLVKLNEAKLLAESLFERLHKTTLFRHVMLEVQYRMHPTISDFPKQKFYTVINENGEVISLKDGDCCRNDRPLIPGFDWLNSNSVCFVEVPSDVAEKTVKTSKFNEVEAEILIDVLSKILSVPQNKNLTVGIITPYAAQQTKIKDLLLSNKKLNDIDVNTVDGFQGQERDLILVSTVRNRDFAGFLDDKRRTNVLLTRSKRGLIVFGRELTLSSMQIWKDWFVWVNERKLVSKHYVTNDQSVNSGQPASGSRGQTGSGNRVRYYHNRGRGYR